MCDALRDAGHAPLIARKTGLVLDAYFSGTKLAWLLDHVPGARRRAERGELAFGTIDSWLVWNLTERRGARHRCDQRLPHAALRPHRATGTTSCSRCSTCRARCCRGSSRRRASCAEAMLGGARVPIAGIAGDQQAALFGQACFAPGLAKNTYGTGCFLLLNTGSDAGRVVATTS